MSAETGRSSTPANRPHEAAFGGLARATAISWGVSVEAAQDVWQTLEFDDGERVVRYCDGSRQTFAATTADASSPTARP